MLLTKQEKEYKEYIALQKRYDEIWKELRKRNYIPLPEPVQKGWEISFVLRDDIKRRQDAPEIQKALDLCQYSFHTRNLKLVKQVRSVKSFRKVVGLQTHKRYGVHMPSLALISEGAFKNLPSSVSCFFDIDVENERWKAFRGSKYRLCIPSFWLELKARPYIVTHQLEKGGELEKEYNYLQDKLRLYWWKYQTNYSASHPAYKDRARMRAQIQKFKKRETDDIIVEKIPKEYDW